MLAAMSLPWKVLILSMLAMIVLQAYELEYLGGWLYSRCLPDTNVAWAGSGAGTELARLRFQAFLAFTLANLAALGWHFASRFFRGPSAPSAD